jgi:nitroimidazol reductase NimA-like FMN-containing flavoprotein (pyridoxamine 5'-phosphate oxidase superfamily)
MELGLDRNGMDVLSREACFEKLGRNGIGRVGVSVGALPAILPIMYAVADGEIYFRTAPGAKLIAARQNAVVAFEADDARAIDHSGWSVLAVGRAEVVSDAELERLAKLPLGRWVGGDHGDVLVRIRPEFISGRVIRQHADA